MRNSQTGKTEGACWSSHTDYSSLIQSCWVQVLLSCSVPPNFIASKQEQARSKPKVHMLWCASSEFRESLLLGPGAELIYSYILHLGRQKKNLHSVQSILNLSVQRDQVTTNGQPSLGADCCVCDSHLRRVHCPFCCHLTLTFLSLLSLLQTTSSAFWTTHICDPFFVSIDDLSWPMATLDSDFSYMSLWLLLLFMLLPHY